MSPVLSTTTSKKVQEWVWGGLHPSPAN